MKLSELFTKTRKDVAKDETSLNAQLFLRAGFVSKEMAGVYSYLPLGLMMLEKIKNIIREEMNAVGGTEISMPALTSIENYKKTGREKIDVLFKTKLHSGSELVLNQSHEEVVTPLVAQFARSYKDLPVATYQIQTKFRNEARAKSGLLRGREFLMKDLYSFHTDEVDLDSFYEKVQEAYHKIFKRLGLGDITFLTFASGGTFSEYSHEFQTLCKTGEDNVYYCKKCNIGVNNEIIKTQKVCPKCKKSDFEVKKTIEVGNIFKLGTRFSKSFDYNYIDKEGKAKPVVMGCYGMGPSRVMGAIAEIMNDENGLVLPEIVAPYKFHVVKLNIEARSTKFETILKNLGEDNCLIDDRDVSAGQKFADADLLGMPYRVVVSAKTLEKDSVEVKKRSEKDGKLVKISDLQ